MGVYVGYILKTNYLFLIWRSNSIETTFINNYNYFQNVSFFNFEVHYLFEIK